MSEDLNLFIKLKNGDRKAFETLFKTWYAPLCLYAQSIVYDGDEVEEIVQGFFVKLWERKASIDISTSVKNYLFSSIKNHCFNYLKHQKIKVKHHDYTLQHADQPIDASDYCMETELMEKIEASIEALSPRRREIFLLSRNKGLKYREIAEELGISIKTVETQMGQALKELREKLASYRQLFIGLALFCFKNESGRKRSQLSNS
jgi:RNA polymerase sigma-70 factor, ECF subfamily